MRCDECDHWLVERLTTYDDGSTVTNFKAADGNGLCDVFEREFAASFFCGEFKQSTWDHREKKHKAGAPWQHSRAGPCPDCVGQGHAVGCYRCAGTGLVRHYDDGYIGDEQTRLHPREKELLKGERPKCVSCERDLDVNWVRCPWCGAITNKPSPREVIGFEEGAAEGTTDEMIASYRRRA